MKKQLLIISMLLLTAGAFAQAKNAPKHLKKLSHEDSVSLNIGTVPKQTAGPINQPGPKQFFVILSEDQWSYLFGVISSSGELTSLEAKKYIAALNGLLHEVPPIAKDTIGKK